MTENPLFSADDDEWLEGILGPLGDNQEQSDPQKVESLDDGIDIENVTEKDNERLGIAGIFFWNYYNPSKPLDTPYSQEELDRAALQMMRNLANFKEHSALKENEQVIRLGDRYPDFSVSDLNWASRFMIKVIKKQLSEPLISESRKADLRYGKERMETFREVSARAVEMENRRKRPHGN